jgi:hypothetical protein
LEDCADLLVGRLPLALGRDYGDQHSTHLDSAIEPVAGIHGGFGDLFELVADAPGVVHANAH